MKQKKQLVILGVLVFVALLVWFGQSGGKPTIPGVVNPGFVAQNYQPLPVENPELRRTEIDNARKTEYKSNGRNPFSMQAAVPETPAGQAKVTGNNMASQYHRTGPFPEPKPQPPTWPGNVSFFGYGTVPNGTARRAFLTVDGEVQVVGEGDTVLGRYRILQVNNGNLEFQDISTGLRNTKALDADKVTSPPA
jgi:hypothetical protein